MGCLFDCSSIKSDYWHHIACCSVIKNAPQCLYRFIWVDERSGVMVPVEYIIPLLLHCLATSWVSLDVLYVSMSSACVSTLLGLFWFRSAGHLLMMSLILVIVCRLLEIKCQ